jgi:antitoxin component YwqK of YwqJK toxin-antitoxin module
MTAPINQFDSQDRRHGVWEWYRSDGTLWCKYNYQHGTLRGVGEWYHPDGTLARKRYYLTIK